MARLTLEHLLALEHEGWSSLCESRGGSFYGHTMTVDALMVLVNGSVLDRDAVVATLDESPRWETYDISEPRLVSLGAGAAALVYRARAVRGDAEPFVAWMSSVYRLVDDEPRLALYQQTTATY